MELIAEIGQAHDGSLGILYSYIDAISTTGVNTVKFQVHIAEAESSYSEPFRTKFSYEDATRFDYWKRMELSKTQWAEIKAYCESKSLQFLASPFSIAAVDLLESIGVDRYKVGSGEVTNALMLDKIGKTGKPVIISSGMSSYDELDWAINTIEKFHSEISIMQCTTEYPTSAERIGFNVVSEMKERYPNFKVGLSEHTGRLETGLAAFVLGADLLEFHAVFDRRMFGPDATSSLTIDEISKLMDGVNFLKTGMEHTIDKNNLEPFEKIKPIFEKSLAVNKDLPVGHVLKVEDLESKKPARMGVSARKYKTVVGKALKVNLNKFDFLKETDIADE